MSEFADLYLRARESVFADPENRRTAPQTRPAPRVRAPLLRPPTPVDMGQRYSSFDDATARGALRAANERGVAALQAGIGRDPYAMAVRAETPISAPETAGVVARAAPGFAAELTGLPSAYRMGQDIGQAAQAFRYGDRLNAADEMVSAGANFLGTGPGGLAAERAITGGIGALGRAARPVIRGAQGAADLPPLAPVRGGLDWQVDRPLFHGTNTPIEGDFRPTRRPTLPEPRGVSFAERPEMAAQFGSSIYPTYARGEIGSAEDFMQRARAKMAQGMSMEAAADAVQQEFIGAGYAGVRFQTGENVIFDPANTISALDPSVASARSGPIARPPAPRTTMQHVTALSRGDWQPTPQDYEAAARTLPPNMAAHALIGAATGAALAPQDAEASDGGDGLAPLIGMSALGGLLGVAGGRFARRFEREAVENGAAGGGTLRGVSAERGAERFWDDRLSPSENKAVEMARNNYTNEEIADEMDNSANAVAVLLGKARKKGVDVAVGKRRAIVQEALAELAAKHPGLNADQLAARMRAQGFENVTRNYVDVIMLKARRARGEAPQEQRPFTPDEIAQALALRDQGKSFVEIGALLGRHPATLSKKLRAGRRVDAARKYGLPLAVGAGTASAASLAPQDAEAAEQPYGNWVIDVSDYPADKDGNRPQSSPRPRVGEFDGNPIPLGPNDPDMYVQPLRDGTYYAFRIDQYGRATPIGRARYVSHSGLTEGPPSGLESGSNSLQALGGFAAGALTRGALKRAPRLMRGIAPVVVGAGAGGLIAAAQGDDAAQGLAFGAGGGGAASLAGIANRARRLAPAPRLSGREIVRVGERSAASVPIDVSAFRPPLNDQYAPLARNPFSGTAGTPSDAAARARGVGGSEDLMLRRARGAVLQQEMGDRLRGRPALAPREAPPLLPPPQTRQARAPQPPPGMEEAMRRAANTRLGRVDARGVANHRAMAAALNDAGLASIDTAQKAPQLRADLARVLSQGSQEQRADMARAIAASTGISLSAALMMVQGAADEHDNSPWQQEQARQ